MIKALTINISIEGSITYLQVLKSVYDFLYPNLKIFKGDSMNTAKLLVLTMVMGFSCGSNLFGIREVAAMGNDEGILDIVNETEKTVWVKIRPRAGFGKKYKEFKDVVHDTVQAVKKLRKEKGDNAIFLPENKELFDKYNIIRRVIVGVEPGETVRVLYHKKERYDLPMQEIIVAHSYWDVDVETEQPKNLIFYAAEGMERGFGKGKVLNKQYLNVAKLTIKPGKNNAIAVVGDWIE